MNVAGENLSSLLQIFNLDLAFSSFMNVGNNYNSVSKGWLCHQ